MMYAILIVLFSSCLDFQDSLSEKQAPTEEIQYSLLGCEDDNKVNGICVNRELPPKPSILSNLLTPGHKEEIITPEVLTFDNPFEVMKQDIDPKYGILPYGRSTEDGRLYLGRHEWGGLAFYYLEPEQLGYDLKLRQSNHLRNSIRFAPIVTGTYHKNFTDINFDDDNKWAGHSNGHPEICHDRYNYLRTCSARLNKNGQEEITEGDCYDISIYNTAGSISSSNRYNEITMTPVTVFVESAKQSNVEKQIHVYPRFSPGEVLPNSDEVTRWTELAGLDGSSNKNRWAALSEQCLTSGGQFPSTSVQAQKPIYCNFIYKRQKLKLLRFPVDNETHIDTPSSATDIPFLFEPTMTADGRLLIINRGLGKGLHYAFNNKGRCDLEGFTDFYPISRMPYDSDIYNRYSIGKAQRRNNKSYPFRDSTGREIKKDEMVPGAYHWIDREGKNIFFAAINHNQARYKSTTGEHLDRSAGKAYQALGAWTNGKMVALDGNINITDFGSANNIQVGINSNNFTGPVDTYKIKLYKNHVQDIRAAVATEMGSPENKLNHYDAMMPELPFDVVWRFSNNRERNSQVAFDDFLNRNLVVYANMHSPLVSIDIGGNRKVGSYKDGYTPKYKSRISGSFQTNGTDQNGITKVDLSKTPEWRLKEEPKLQNAATLEESPLGMKIADELDLTGGARVETVGQGGVYGKGVYLDGHNDTISFKPDVKEYRNWIFSLWIDPRNLNSTPKTIYEFVDKSKIQISSNYITALDNEKRVQTINVQDIGLKNSQFFHLTTKVFTVTHPTNPDYRYRKIHFYINGTRVEHTLKFNEILIRKDELSYLYKKDKRPSFRLKRRWLWEANRRFSIGDQEDADKSLAGWFDEFKLYEFPIQSGVHSSPYPREYEELICNNAFGSLVQIYSSDSTKHLASLRAIGEKHHTITKSFGEISNITSLFNPGYKRSKIKNSALICEQLSLKDNNTMNEFADQRNYSLCAANTHKNKTALQKLRCKRDQILGLDDTKAVFDQPRPEARNNNFCLTCHTDSARITGLDIQNALKEKDYIRRQHDPRRQPLEHKAVLNGCAPDLDPILGFGTFNDGCENNSPIKMDKIFDFEWKITPLI